jgi:hypothetical protein
VLITSHSSRTNNSWLFAPLSLILANYHLPLNGALALHGGYVHKTFIQSQFQSIFNRLYLGLIQFFWMILPLILMPMLMDEPFKDLSFTIYGLFIGIALITLWLMIFNTGKSKLIGHGLKFDDNGIVYMNYGSNKTIEWGNFKGFIVKNNFPRMVVLSSNDKNNIEFSYYTFGSNQRREIFDYLELK